jgi:hypothetical protein
MPGVHIPVGQYNVTKRGVYTPNSTPLRGVCTRCREEFTLPGQYIKCHNARKNGMAPCNNCGALTEMVPIVVKK